MDKYYILDGHAPVVERDLMAWAAWFETAEHATWEQAEAGHAKAVALATEGVTA